MVDSSAALLGLTVCKALLLLVLGVLASLYWMRSEQGVVPGRVLARATGAALITLYLAGGIRFGLGVDEQWLLLLPVIWLGMLYAARRQVAALFRDPQVTLAVKALLALWTVSFFALTWIHNYTGGVWSLDWLEHFQRSEFFRGRFPPDRQFIGLYSLPSRPPMPSIVTSVFVALCSAGERFDFAAYQVTLLLIGSLFVVPWIQLATSGGQKRLALLLAVLFANPMVMQNLTYAWTRMPCAVFILLSLLEYLAEFRKERPRLCWCWSFAAAAILMHYSAVLYALILLAHRASVVWNAPTQLRGLPREFAPGAALASSWIISGICYFGGASLVTSTTSYSDTAKLGVAENVLKVLAHTATTLFPAHLLVYGPTAAVPIESFASWLRECGFALYQANAVFMLGSLGATVAFAYGVRSATTGRFLKGFAAAVILIGPMLVGIVELKGLAHIQLQPVGLLGLAWLCNSWERIPRSVRRLLYVSWVVDFLIGVALHHYLQSVQLQNINWEAKTANRLEFVADLLHPDARPPLSQS